MNRREIEEVLASFRPGVDDPADPLFAEAIAAARKEPELKEWLEDSIQFDKVFAEELAKVRPPGDLRDILLAQAKIVRPVRWWSRGLSAPQLAAAALLMVTLFLAAHWWRERPRKFDDFRQDIAMASWGVVPHLDLASTNLDQIRRYLSQNNVRVDFDIPPALAGSLHGCGIVTWRGHQVPYLCAGAQGQHYHVAIVERSLFADAPSDSPEVDRWEAWRIATWSKEAHAYVVTGLSAHAFLKKFRKDKRWDWEG